jgi:hypothetical protein
MIKVVHIYAQLCYWLHASLAHDERMSRDFIVISSHIDLN